MLPVLIWLLGWFQWWLGIPAAALLTLALWKVLSGPWRLPLPLVTLALFVVTLARVMLTATGNLFAINTGWWLGIPATALLVFALWKAVSNSLRSSVVLATFALLLLAWDWVMLTAAGGLFDINNDDWDKHRAILHDLGQHAWPVHLPNEANNLLPLLRYYLGWYMVPGLAAHWLGYSALNWALPIWTWLGVALILLLFTRGYHGWKVILAVVVLIFFSGMDFLRIILFEGWDWIKLSVDFDDQPWIQLGRYHIEWDRYWGLKIQYSSNMTGLMFVPQHFIPAALYTLLAVQLRQQPRFLAVSGVVLAASLFWSPFVALGLLPLVAILIMENGLRPFLRWPNLLLALPLAGLLVLYLTSGSVDFPRGWLWENYEWPKLAEGLPVFYLTEFLLLAFLLLLVRPQLRRDPFFIVALTTLILLPCYSYGQWNDLVMRASLPALFLLCWYATGTLSGRRPEITRGRGIALVGLILVLCIGAVTPLFNIVGASNDAGVFRHEWAPRSILMDQPKDIHHQYAALDIPEALRWLLRDKDDINRMYAKGNL